MQGTPAPAKRRRLHRTPSHCFFPDLFRADAHCVLDWEHEHFSIPDFAGFGCGYHYAYSLFHHVVRHYYFHFYFGQKIDRVFAPSIDFSVAFLPSEAFDFGDGHPLDPELGQRLFDLFELEGFDDGFQFFHVKVNSASRGLLQSNAKRSTRSLSNNMKPMQASSLCPLKSLKR